jgi:hypothetical protein
VGVVFALEQARQLLVGDDLLDPRQARLYLGDLCVGVLLLRQLGQKRQVLDLPEQLLDGVEVAPAAADIALKGRGRCPILPDVGGGGPLFQLLQFRFTLGQVKDDPSAHAPV